MIRVPLALLFLPIITAIMCLLVNNRKIIGVFNLGGGVLIAAAAYQVAGSVFSQGTIEALGFIYIDALGAFIISIVAIIGLAASLYSVGYTLHEINQGEIPESRLKWYYFWFYIFIFTMFLVVVVNNLGVMWVAIEGTTLASALLVGYYDKKSSLEAAWKYIIICTVGIVFALFGTILLYYAAIPLLGEGSGALNWKSLILAADKLDPKLIKLAFIFILVGYGTKAGLAPMHTWLPDAHSQAPSPVSAMLSGVLLNCALYGIIRFHLIVSGSVGPNFSSNLLLIFGLFSIAVSLPFIIVQHDLKRLLAYSSIEHIGIITAAIGLGGKLGLYGAFLHMFNHAMTKTSLFFAAGNITQKYKTKKIAKIKGVIKVMPITGTAMVIGGLAIAGAPPFSIFLSEFSILSSGFAQGRYMAAGLMLVFITLVFAGIVYAVSGMALGSPQGRTAPGELGKWSAVMVVLPLIIVTVMGMYIPSFIDNILRQVVLVMAGGIY
ncbi:hydrogenase 4 subunit F [Phosphitispora sp. TUW77]|uniref:hydrogenase 4 subunit F n=1 Tax=Phosphitispora sp. TUW77 TaxID=3152361 RepID=UPI003AB4DDE3